MAFRINHLNKKTGVTYVYEEVSFWDKEKKQSRNKQVCIGKLDPSTGEYIPSKRLQPGSATIAGEDALPSKVTATIVGPSIILDAFSKRLGLEKLLKAAFPDSYRQILSMAYYLTAQGGALSQCEGWTKTHDHPSKTPLVSQRISEILGSITTNEKQTFLSLWMNKIVEDEYLCYDITSISSYATLNEYIRYGHNRDKEKLPQLNLGKR